MDVPKRRYVSNVRGSGETRMSRLYAWLENDRGSERTLAGNTELRAVINYGSKKKSKLAVKAVVLYAEGEEKPTVRIIAPIGIRVQTTRIEP